MAEQGRARRAARVAAITIAGGALIACATPYGGAPVATDFPASQQPKLQAAAHWATIADRSAEALVHSLAAAVSCPDPAALCPRVYVRPAAQQTVFAQNFRAAFITALVRQKVTVAHTPAAGAIAIDIDVQTVRFSADRPNGTFIPASLVYAGAWAVYGLAANASPAAAGLAGAAMIGGYDAWRWASSETAAGPTPQTEVLVTVSASDATRYLGRVAAVYYAADSDARLYTEQQPLFSIAVGGDR
ncbi:MAG TPA: hypothetical protein PK440_10645 [Candidatus Accumulibacter phosphatis]|nr:MAG: hypothetical protein AW07_03004 [Candidatus Accumulibacter sp. SK-11]HAY26701.1 hypothetical protein [Accumulibacter sp.]HRL77345.1 hypothetical protein [Candidatus Accumulibacter phosphatis]HRQ95435.1 hypothetical protein [Candidatus Accumulibacter phosphatis]